MYPLEASAAYPRNQWYIAGYGHEFVAKVFARQILGDKIIFYRTEAGEPVALSARCVHRHMPLDTAELRDGAVVCPYHGYAYASDGRCREIPTGGPISPHARLRCYPVVERGPFVWIWMGDPEKPEVCLLPNPVEIGLGDGQSDWCIVECKTYPVKCRAPLLVDNLFDLSHAAFVHPTTLGAFGSLVMVPPVIETIDGRLRVSRTIPGMEFEPGSYFDKILPVIRGCGPTIFLIHTEIYCPGLIYSTGPWVYSKNENDKSKKYIAKLNFVHGVTPETGTSTHYFSVVTRDYEIDNMNLSEILRNQNDAVREEDIFFLESVEISIDGRPTTRREISTKVDEGAIKIRKYISNLIKSEYIKYV
jgi:vanillate O-demethylase monooxygenase subunit